MPDALRTERPAPPAWMMAPAPDLLTPLNEIISPSESGSKPPQSK
ncbi:Rz1 family lipoprotein [Leclercia adecarboxylata]|nr:Rz1 family lipoprotein [Leclercia adecarboxylata]MBZ3803562.1 Rz1 family lipoprotein [Leclercia adecarboxylata]